jgi:hypothetical protein
MSNTPYRILFTDPADEYAEWRFDETEYESAEAAFDDSLKRHPSEKTVVVKICYPVGV